MKKILHWLRDYNAWIQNYHHAITAQRDAEYREYLIWRGIVK